MKKLLLLTVLTVAGVAQAVEYCGERIQCRGSVRKGETHQVTCPDCVCPEVKCPIPAEVVCEARAVPMKSTVCPQIETCGKCGLHRRHHVHGCKSGNCCKGLGSCARYETVVVAGEETTTVEKKQMRTPKRVVSNRNN